MAPRKKIAKRQLELRNRLWADLDLDTNEDELLWTRQVYNGFTTLPKAMPLMLGIMDDLAGGQPVSGTYLELWCRTFDDNFVVLSKQEEIAFHSGFSGQRAVRTWKGRLKLLAELGFIKLAAGPSGDCSYALILNPYHVIRDLQAAGKGVRQDKYNALLARAVEIDDESLAPAPLPKVAAKPAA
ncbi:hypothetical protein [Brucella anthropi]|uniref:hypothetical protein n=1 Tax=Brucella anthropi TaxID=529 RepID=UPI00068E1577|nr:hypothetical protein [Brucella anthropi]